MSDDRPADDRTHLVARIGRLASGAGRCRTTAPSLTLGPLPCRSKPRQLSPPHSEAAVPGDQLGRVRRRSTRPRQPDRVVHAGGNRGLGGSAAATRGGQPSYSDLAIATALTLRAVFRLALRQTEGLIGSILQLLDLDLAVPDHSTLSRRAETLKLPKPRSGLSCGPVHLLVDSTGLQLCGPGEWLT